MDSRTFVVVGMAGSGKTTFCHRLYSWLSTEVVLKDGLNSLITSINLDPAVKNAKMPLTIDIRDTVDYEETIHKYNLGPNGCINTCLNIFLLNFKKPEQSKYAIVDTPGQIEAFTWSSPGDALMSILDNVCILYVIDTSICKNKYAFVNNMLFAAALKCKFRRPVLVVFNKSDLSDLGGIVEWIRDFEALKAALTEDEASLHGVVLFFEEFYKNMDFVSLSSYTGSGKDDFFRAVDKIYGREGC